MAEIVRRRSWGGVLPLGRQVSISGSSFIQCASASIAPPHPGRAKCYPGAEVQGRTGSNKRVGEMRSGPLSGLFAVGRSKTAARLATVAGSSSGASLLKLRTHLLNQGFINRLVMLLDHRLELIAHAYALILRDVRYRHAFSARPKRS